MVLFEQRWVDLIAADVGDLYDPNADATLGSDRSAFLADHNYLLSV